MRPAWPGHDMRKLLSEAPALGVFALELSKGTAHLSPLTVGLPRCVCLLIFFMQISGP